MRQLQTPKESTWRQFAACRGMDSGLFFPERAEPGRSPYKVHTAIKEAKKICSGCPARVGCLEYGLHERYGIWGGHTKDERKIIASKRRLSKLAS